MMKSNKRMDEALSRVFGPGRTVESVSNHPNNGKIKAALKRLIAAVERGDELAEDEALRDLENLKKAD